MKNTESITDASYFVFFNDYDEDRFDDFVSFVLSSLSVTETRRELGPYSPVVTIFYEGYEVVLTNGSYEGCYICVNKEAAFLTKKIVEKCSVLK